MEICRLCLLNSNHYINIFGDFEPNKNVADIIGKHVGEVIESDPLPNQVCIECWTKIENFHDFYTSIQTAQARYLSDLVKYERETNHFVDVLESVHLNFDEPIDVLASVADEQNEAAIKNEYELPKQIFIEETSEHLTNETIEYDETSNDDCFETRASERTGGETESDKMEKAKKQLDAIKSQKKSKSFLNRKEYICDMCSKVFPSKQKLLDHLLRHIKYVCSICSVRCLNKLDLDIHVKTDHSKDNIEKAKKQLDAIETKFPDTPEFPNAHEIQEILAKHYDATCDYCMDSLPPSLEQAQAHYLKEHEMNGYLKCCDLRLETIDSLNEHVIYHLYPEYYKCKLCDSRFVHGNVLKKLESVRWHITRHLNDAQRYMFICTECRAQFSSKNSLNVHRKYHHGIDESNSDDSSTDTKHKKYRLADFFTMRCDLCDDVQFSTFQNAKQHYRTVHEIKGYLMCCDKKFMKPRTIDDHLRWHTNPLEHLKCPYCGKCFIKKMSLSVHISKHKAVEEKRFPCPKCNKFYHSNHYLKRHIETHTTDKTKKTVPCPHCPKQYTTEQSLRFHIKYAHSNPDHKKSCCEICGKQFVSQNVVKSHVRNVHCSQSDLNDRQDLSKRSQCTMCDASFINKYRLKKHIDTIHLSEPVKCELCDKIAPNPCALACHMKAVHVAQNFQCHLCAKAFKAAHALKDHIATHTGEKMYKCSYCPESFIWRPNMYSHQKKAHPEEWKAKKTVLK